MRGTLARTTGPDWWWQIGGRLVEGWWLVEALIGGGLVEGHWWLVVDWWLVEGLTLTI